MSPIQIFSQWYFIYLSNSKCTPIAITVIKLYHTRLYMFEAPDDGWVWHPKHLERRIKWNKILKIVASSWCFHLLQCLLLHPYILAFFVWWVICRFRIFTMKLPHPHLIHCIFSRYSYYVGCMCLLVLPIQTWILREGYYNMEYFEVT